MSHGHAARWETFPHDADVGICGHGGTAAEAFEQAACALTAVVTVAEVKPVEEVDVACEAPDLELLFVEWLNAIIYEMAVRRMLFSRFSAAIEGAKLRGRLWGDGVDVERHAPACEPRAQPIRRLRLPSARTAPGRRVAS